MPVPFQEFVAKAAASLDKAGGVPPFVDMFDAILPVLDVTPAAGRWEWDAVTIALGIGNSITLTVPDVPNDEFHLYHYIFFAIAESGSKRVRGWIEGPDTASGLAMLYWDNTVEAGDNVNLASIMENVGELDMSLGRAVPVPSRFRLIVQMVTPAVAAVNCFMGYVRQVLPASFETRRGLGPISTVIV